MQLNINSVAVLVLMNQSMGVVLIGAVQRCLGFVLDIIWSSAVIDNPRLGVSLHSVFRAILLNVFIFAGAFVLFVLPQ